MPVIRNASCPQDPSHDHYVQSFYDTSGTTYTCPISRVQWTWCVIDRIWCVHSRWYHGQQVTLVGGNRRVHLCEGHAATYYCERCSLYGWEEDQLPQGYEQCVVTCAEMEDDDGSYYEYLCYACQTAIIGTSPRSSYIEGTCRSCSNPREHFDLIKEQYVCSCQVETLIAANPAHPIKMAKARDLASVMS